MEIPKSRYTILYAAVPVTHVAQPEQNQNKILPEDKTNLTKSIQNIIETLIEKKRRLARGVGQAHLRLRAVYSIYESIDKSPALISTNEQKNTSKICATLKQVKRFHTTTSSSSSRINEQYLKHKV